MIFYLGMLANKRYKSYKLSLVDAEIMEIEICNGGENWTRIYGKILLPWLSARWRCKFYWVDTRLGKERLARR